MNSAEFRRRLEVVKRYLQPNEDCHGTTLYLLGLKETPGCATPTDLLEYLSEEDLEIPEIGYVGLIESRSTVLHSGIVICESPVLLTHRAGYKGPIVENESADRILNKYQKNLNILESCTFLTEVPEPNLELLSDFLSLSLLLSRHSIIHI